MNRDKALEAVLWSIAVPGFGQFLNKHIVKGIVLILFEVIINVYSHFNTAIMLSFLGDIEGAIHVTNYQWLMFYPCFYMYSIWDAYKYSRQGITKRFSYLPLAFAAYSVTVGLMYSYKIKVFGYILGPVWLPMLFVIPGLLVGYIIRLILLKMSPVN
ncbi:hypothetical protein [Litchfieldia alkalitelluris]|uniref:hypothetical protein n=1 Tax=Litchfieldia alkalitelluris TaxID=304268 RepID=UPI0009977692|nr:hypothetical protein [Litchfieldia alkalitelluris]